MASVTSCCFQEDDACVIIDDEVVRRLAQEAADGCTEACAKEACEVDELVVFLGRALLLTRRTLYVLLCVPPNVRTTPCPAIFNKPHCDIRDHRFGDAASFVSCGMQIWQLIMYLNTRVGSLARRLELTAVPIIIPWDCEVPHEQVQADGPASACTHWVERARAAVLRHYRLAVGCRAVRPSADEAALSNAVPLILDSAMVFSSRVACDFWPRHCHLNPLRGGIQGRSSGQEPSLEVEGHNISSFQQSASREENRSGVADRRYSQGLREAIGGGDTANADGELKTEAPFGYTLVAGTFDRLHAGHQLLLAAATLSARQQIGLAVASGPLVDKKVASEEDVAAAGIEPFACRLKSAAAFVQLLAASKGKVIRLRGFREALGEEATSLSDELQLQFSLLSGSNEFICGSRPAMEANTEAEALDGSLQLQIFRITDAVGPADRLAFDCLVVSAETLKGANKVNSIRVEAGNEAVFVLSVGLVTADAEVGYQAAEALAAYLPFPRLREVTQPERKCELSRLAGTKYSVQHKAPVALEEKEVRNSVPQKYQNSTCEPMDAFRNKLSSTTLRQQQVMRLGCGSIAELCKRFRSAWLWLEGKEGEAESTNGQLCATLWNLLCAEHAAPWRRLHTFDRVARSLKRLDVSKAFVKREPIVLSVFFGSLLASPCHYITVTRSACATSDSDNAKADDANSCTLASWSPEAEDAAWQISATELLAGLQCKWGLRPDAAKQNGGRDRGMVPGASTFDRGDVLLEGHFSLLMGLLLEQRAATHTTLASTGQALNALREERAAAWGDEESAAMMRLSRRLEQLEFTDRSGEEATRLQRLQQEYFFVSKDCFRRYRMKQLAQLLENASGLDCLNHEECRSARTNIERELDMLACQS